MFSFSAVGCGVQRGDPSQRVQKCDKEPALHHTHRRVGSYSRLSVFHNWIPVPKGRFPGGNRSKTFHGYVFRFGIFLLFAGTWNNYTLLIIIIIIIIKISNIYKTSL